MAETFNWQVGKKETFNWQLPVVAADVPQTNVFTSEDGTQTFISEDGQNFRSE